MVNYIISHLGALGSVFLRFLLYSYTPNIVMNHFYSVYDDSIFVDGRFITTLGMAVIVNSDIVKYIQLPRGDTYDLVEIDAIPFVYIYDMNAYDRFKLLDENMNPLQ